MVDSTPMRIYADKICRLLEIYGRDVALIRNDGSRLPVSPLLDRSSSRDAHGAPGAIRLSDLRTGAICSERLQFKFAALRCDGVNVIHSAIRWIRIEEAPRPNFLVVIIICWIRVICNSTRWPLTDFPFGPMLGRSHVLEIDAPSLFDLYCKHVIGIVTGEIGKRGLGARAPEDTCLLFTGGGVACVGGFLEQFMSPDGPFADLWGSTKLPEMEKKAAPYTRMDFTGWGSTRIAII